MNVIIELQIRLTQTLKIMYWLVNSVEENKLSIFDNSRIYIFSFSHRILMSLVQD